MSNKDDSFADARMRKVSRRLNAIYRQASEELTEKVDSFFDKFREMDEKKAKLVEEGKLSEREYKEWRKNKMLMGKNYQDLRDTMTERMQKADELAVAYMNGELPAVYAHNFNRVGEDAEALVKGFSFDLVNEEAVRKLSTSDKTLLPYKIVDGKRNTRWNTKHVNSAILQGILQGESIPKIAKRLRNVTQMNKASSIRNARTAITGAQNKGRYDAMDNLAQAGLPIRKQWIATTGDGRTREAHLELHMSTMPYDKPFQNSIGRIMYPGDPNAHPSNVYNCRCSLVTDFSEVLKQAQAQEQEEEYTGRTYYHLIDSLEGATVEEMEALNNRFSQLDKTYHAKVDNIISTLQREQDHWDIDYANRLAYEKELSPRARKTTLDRRVKELLGERPTKVDPLLCGDYASDDPWYGHKSIMTLNSNGTRIGNGINDDIERRQKRIKRNNERIQEGRSILHAGNVGDSLESTFIHEYGHAIDYTYGIVDNPKFVSFYQELTEEDINGISFYATTNAKEFIAEAFCESFMGDTQGEVSKRFMKILEEIIHDKH